MYYLEIFNATTNTNNMVEQTTTPANKDNNSNNVENITTNKPSSTTNTQTSKNLSNTSKNNTNTIYNSKLQKVYTFSGTLLNKKLADFASGKIAVFYFWNGSCDFCGKELLKISAVGVPENTKLIPVAVKTKDDIDYKKAKSFIASNKGNKDFISLMQNMLFDNEKEIIKSFNIEENKLLGSIIVLDIFGQIINKRTGTEGESILWFVENTKGE